MRILCVDLGNLCRGPMAEAVLRARFAREGLCCEISSAGASVSEAGALPDIRAILAAGARGYDIRNTACRAVEPTDLVRHDLLLAMDRWILGQLLGLSPERRDGRMRLLHPEGREVIDPYCGTAEDFDLALDIIEDAADGLATILAAQRLRA